MKGFFRNHNNIYNHVIPIFNKTNNLIECDFFAGWNDLVQPDKRIVELAKEYKKTSFILEHGMKAVSDYQKGLKDIHNNMGGKPFIGDNIMVWGDVSKDILLEAGIDQKKIHVVGSPIIWDHSYKYINKKKGDKWVPFNAGQTVIDKSNGDEWELEQVISEIPKNEKRNMIVFFPHHDFTKQAVENNKKIWDEIKDIPSIFTKLTPPYMKDVNENPFREILEISDPQERRSRFICVDTCSPKNLEFIKLLLKKCKLVISAIPGTINGICWAMDVPILVPKIDWGWRDNKGDVLLDIHDADYSCDLGNIRNTVEKIICNDTKYDERMDFAKKFMGIDKGNALKNIVETIKRSI